MNRLCLLWGLLLIFPPYGYSQRLVTANLCADNLALALVPERLVAVSELARDPELSPMAEAAQNYPVHNGTAESIVTFRPDLVIGGEFGAHMTLNLLERLNYRVERLPLPRDIPMALASLRTFAQWVNAEAKGEQMIAALAPHLVPQPPHERALVYLPRGFTAGQNTLVTDLLATGGMQNATPFTGWGYLSVEQVVRLRPDVLFLPDETPSFALAHLPLRHPILEHTIPRRSTLTGRSWGCSGPWLRTAVDQLKAGQ